jgi:hypothetical protein
MFEADDHLIQLPHLSSGLLRRARLLGLVLELGQVSVVLHLFAFEILDLSYALVDFFSSENVSDSPANNNREKKRPQAAHFLEEWHLSFADHVASPGLLNYSSAPANVLLL